MLIKILFNYIIGYIRISIEGYYIERFINICRNNKIPFSLAGYLRKDEISFYKKMGVDRITVNYVNLPQLNKRFEKLPELDLLLKIKENTKRRREILENKEGAK